MDKYYFFFGSGKKKTFSRGEKRDDQVTYGLSTSFER